MESESTRVPITRLLILAVGISTVVAVATTFAQKLLVGDVNPAITAAVTGAITAVYLSRESRATATCEEQSS